MRIVRIARQPDLVVGQSGQSTGLSGDREYLNRLTSCMSKLDAGLECAGASALDYNLLEVARRAYVDDLADRESRGVVSHDDDYRRESGGRS